MDKQQFDHSQQVPPQEHAILVTFKDSYLYTTDIQQADVYLPTADIYEMLKDSNGALDFDVKYLDTWLQKEGYASTMVGMKRVWLFKKI